MEYASYWSQHRFNARLQFTPRHLAIGALINNVVLPDDFVSFQGRHAAAEPERPRYTDRCVQVHYQHVAVACLCRHVDSDTIACRSAHDLFHLLRGPHRHSSDLEHGRLACFLLSYVWQHVVQVRSVRRARCGNWLCIFRRCSRLPREHCRQQTGKLSARASELVVPSGAEARFFGSP